MLFFNLIKSAFSHRYSLLKQTKCGVINNLFLHTKNNESISSLQLKKRPLRKKISNEIDNKPVGVYNVVAFATAEEYDIEQIINALILQDLYKVNNLNEINVNKNEINVVHGRAKYNTNSEFRDLYIFREGSCVLWNCTELESSNILNFLEKFHIDSYSKQLIEKECEQMNYFYNDTNKSNIMKDGMFSLSKNNLLDKYTFSNVMCLSVKLGIWEALLEKYVDSIEFVTEDLKKGKKIKMTREEVLRKHGELFALKHLINLGSDLLDTPDFYWENEELEKLYLDVCHYFNIAKRTRVMNEKINHCMELIELLSTHLSDKHHIRLEWMIIILIMVEVGFETLHYIDPLFMNQ